jgi:hypothetical protein
VLDDVNDGRSREFSVVVVILHDFCRLIVRNPQLELSSALKVVIQASLETITHSGFGPETMTFTEIVPIQRVLGRQVPYDHVGVLP